MSNTWKVTLTLLACVLLSGLHSCGGYDSDDAADFGVENIHRQQGYKMSPYRVRGVTYKPLSIEDSLRYSETGVASWYGGRSSKLKTANGEVMRSSSCYTAAHKTLPLPSIVKVTSLASGKSVHVRVNDRGPFTKGRVIDVSPKAAEALNMKKSGLHKVKVEVISVGDGEYRRYAKDCS